MERVDVIIVGGGPAGLSAALVLGRCGRRVVLFDHGRYRNSASRELHGFLTRDGISPSEFGNLAREQLAAYPSVTIRRTEVVDARQVEHGFEVECRQGEGLGARALLLATGLVDRMPEVPGLAPLLGTHAFHCPYCDGWEQRDQALFAYGRGNGGARFALELTLWSSQIALCIDDGEAPDSEHLSRLSKRGIPLLRPRIVKVEPDGDRIRVFFADGSTHERRALFYNLGCQQGSPLATRLGASLDEREGVEADRCEETSVPNLFVAGDASRDALQAIVAAGEGSKAALAINKLLMQQDLG